MKPKELAIRIANILDEKKAEGIEVLDISPLTTVAEYFVICTGNSTTQVKSLADAVTEKCDEESLASALRTEGYKTCSWILIDYGSVVVHIFKKDMRDFYSLERLWGDAEKISFR